VLGTAVLGGIITAFYHGALVLPAGLPADAARAAQETLAGAYTAAAELPAELGDALWDAAASAFGSGVMITSLIGAVLVVAAGVIAAVTLRKAPTH
jgi:DHA2 family multidrug resistance protein-like MFS transporter